MFKLPVLNNLLTALAEGTTITGGAEGQPQPSIVPTLVIMALMIVVFYFFLIRPQRKKDKAVKNMLNALKVGDRVLTIGGIYGTITGLRDDQVILSVGKAQTVMNMARWAIKSVEDAPLENDKEPEL